MEALYTLNSPPVVSFKEGSCAQDQGLPVAQKAYLFKELHLEAISRSRKVGLFGYR